MAPSKTSNTKFFDPFSKEDLTVLTQVSGVLKQNGMQFQDFGDYLQSYSKEKLRSEQQKITKQNDQNVPSAQETSSIPSDIPSKVGEQERYSEASKTQNTISAQNIKRSPANQAYAEPESNKDIVLTMAGTFKHTAMQIDNVLKQSNNNLSKEELKSLSDLNITLKKLNQELEALGQQSEAKLQQELESTRQLKEHEEKQKGFMEKMKEGGKEVADTLASLLLPEAWYEQAKERENELANSKQKEPKAKESKPEKSADMSMTEERPKQEITPQIQEKADLIKKTLQNHSPEPIAPTVPLTKELEQKRNQNFSQDLTPGKTRS